MSGYWAFLSYSSRDHAWADWLHRSLEAYAVPRRIVGRPGPTGPAPRRFRPIFRDRADLAADADLTARIAQALEESVYLIVICSPAAAASRWVDEEIRRFRELHGRDRILSVIVAGEPEPGRQDCFPPTLRESADGRRAEPIAPDLRPGGDGRRMVLLKLVAGMLGVGLDELVKREDSKRRRQLVLVSGGAFLGMTIMGSLAASAILARDDAQARRARAEDLVEYMLTDLRKKLEPTGRLDLMDAVGRKTLSYYASEPARDLDAAALARRSRALHLVGEVSSLRGNLTEALASFEAASAITAEALRRTPNNGDRIFDHAQSVFWVGEVAWQRGDLDKAERAFQAYRILAQRLIVLDPRRDDWQAELGYAYTNLGTLRLEEGHAAEAAGDFSRSLAVKEQLVAKAPQDASRQMDLGQAHAWLADASERLGDVAAARAHRSAELEIYRRILARDPAEHRANFSSIVAQRAVARLDLAAGDRQSALARYTAAASRAESLLALQPDNMDIDGVAAIAQLDLAEADLAAGHVDAAQRAEQRGAQLVRTALEHDKTVSLWRDYGERDHLIAAAIDLRGGDPTAALSLDRATLAETSAAVPIGLNTEARWLLERARLQTGDDLAALRDTGAAKAQWMALARDLSSPLEAYEPRLLQLLQLAEQRLGRAEQARAVEHRLAALSHPA